jgi:glyoxylase-like metal-dependent hydrolase (beta-lactamase superfamily II)
LAIDYGSGAWLTRLHEIGIKRLEHVVLTHTHRDQCAGLYRGGPWPFEIHLPSKDAELLGPEALGQFWQTYQRGGCPPTYSAPSLPLENFSADLNPDNERLLGPVRLCAISTPGHTPSALTYLAEWHGRHLAFCGDVAHAGGTLHQPFHLEWDHWTASGALAAWYGLERLNYCHFDVLLPSHGPVINQRPGSCIGTLQKRLMAFIRAKGSVCAGEPNRWLDLKPVDKNIDQVLPHLYRFGSNGYLLLSAKGTGLVIDPTQSDMPALETLLRHLNHPQLTAAVATHYHIDHSDALNAVRHQYGAAIWLHPWVAEPIKDCNRFDLPYLPAEPVSADRLLPTTGRFRWQEYRFDIRPFPGQTWWHCAFDAVIDTKHVLFSGDNFQPPSRWNGTGGFCAFNGSRFVAGFGRSAQTALNINPDIICNGHRIVYAFAPSHYRRILRWTAQAEKAVRELCPNNRAWLAHYDYRASQWEPFISRSKPGQTINLYLAHRNHNEHPVSLNVQALAPSNWSVQPAKRQGRIAADKTRRFGFGIAIPRRTPKGRYVVAAEQYIDGQAQGEACVALIDII